MQLTFDKLKSLFPSRLNEGNFSIKLFKADNAPLIISFLYKEFKENGKLVISNQDLVSRLVNFMYQNQIEIEQVQIGAQYEDLETRSRRYIDEWAKDTHNWLTKSPDDQGGHVHSITQHTERVFRWLESLDKKEFIGTESRFQDIIFKLSEILEKSKEDPEQRILALEEKKKEIEREIKEILVKKSVRSFTDTEIKERFFEVNKISRELLADFNEVEQNFKEILRTIYERQTQQEITKGQLLGYTLDALDELKRKDQGKSFYAFWEFLIQDSKQESLKMMVEQVYSLLEYRGIPTNDRYLKRIKSHLHSAASKVMESNRLIAEKLNRTLVEKNLFEHKKALEMIAKIRNSALQLIDKNTVNDFYVEIDGNPLIDLPMEKPLADEEKDNMILTTPESSLNDFFSVDFSTLFNQFSINKEKLEKNIKLLLENKDKISLQQVVDQYPIENGLPEILAYFSIASQSSRNKIIQTENEFILTSENERIKVPKIIFVK